MATDQRRSVTTQPIGPSAEPPADRAAVRIRGLSKSFGNTVVLDDLDLDLRPGEFAALLGRSGSGKSTLLRILADLDRAVSGTAEVLGSVSMAFQEPRLLPWRPVWQNLVLGMPSDRADRETAERALTEVELSGAEDRWPITLSGGQAQRVSLARALVREPDVLLLDEPFGALDALTRMSMHRLVTDLWHRHRPAVLLVTHDVDEALLLADRVLVLDEGRIVADHPVDVPHPRDPERLAGLRRTVLADLGVVVEDAA
jgi:sulfonate transport system ATP-binding protein